ncbi:hypothetical protein INT46_005756 [Mucor plumbeus]|uniref:BHLH domain-containing protein n=1 Tax=Mucor plumbeus TaxID=97098 RepID=A0A8H7UYY8_9FUNG|nr:hypothetical protein INT46_005756 [Mucor plumbeus]
MLQQDMADLDFDTYFDVTSNPIHPHHHNHHQQQQQSNYEQSIHPTQQLNISNRFNASLPVSQQQQYYLPHEQQQQQHQQPFEMFDWCFKQQHPQMLNDTSTRHRTAVSTSGVYPTQQLPQHQTQTNSARTSISPQFQMQQQGQQTMIKDEVFDYNNNNHNNYMSHNEQHHPITITAATTMSAPVISAISSANNATGLPTPISDIIFPGTPKSHTSIHSTESNSPSSTSEPITTVSPALDIPPPLTNAFAAIDQWRKSNDDEAIPDCSKENYHETRHWRKTKRSNSVSSNTSNMVAAAVAAVAARSTPRDSSPVETGRQLKKVAHNAIERRYRTNINDRIRDLKNVVPALYKAKIREKKSCGNSKSNTEEDEDEAAESSDDDNNVTALKKTGEIVDGVEVAKKLNKATILHKATEYIHHLKHTNELAEHENQVLQQILAQMPGGTKVLARFQVQKLDLQQAEQQRLLAERKELMERERAERQAILRERAAQRAALAELLPKPERKPYRRRAKKSEITDDNKNKSIKDDTKQPQTAAGSNETKSNNTTSIENNGNNKAFMAIFLCLAIVSPLSFENTTAKPYHGGRAISHQQQILIRSLPSSSISLSSIEYW